LEWDGKDSQGRKLDIGIYIIFIKAEDQETGRIKVHKNTVVIANSLN
jgi:hypothetical protein